ncbi:hypothetical protein EDD21DRAFT_126368 [Dissophora ornata]|nr:hypothetical protein EDD21DRAFT_126368 [Dissophora ornata]
MEEQLFYIRSQQTSYAVFAPLVKMSSTSTDRAAADDDGDDDEEIKAMMETLPFYYPKVRGFRYGYISDLEESPEDRDDYGHDHDQEPQAGDASFEYEDNDCCAEGTKTSGNDGKVAKKVMSKRVGWITLDLFLSGDEGEFTNKMQYAFKELFKKLYKWGVNTTKGFTKSRVQHDVMVPKELYLTTYARIKERHAQKWVQSWPEKTDPRKFVFEDIAIASWLIALWELELRTNNQEPEEGKKQTFVDLGCGNGLLTHILNEEGHKGTGIDIVARKVWDIYGLKTQLEAKTVIPNETMFENVDWIIGNHADELAPWIPIIAMRSKPLTRFVVIPCCFFDLNGSRYQFPKGAPEGKYKAYQDYICGIIRTCSYNLQTEILRIPSTKNVALVGMTRTWKRKRNNERGEEEDEEDNDCQGRVDELVSRSGLFVARVSDKDKQALQKTKHAAKLLARESEAEQGQGQGQGQEQEQEQDQNELDQETLEKST